ncbi:hypothetical protein [Paludisphaera mucosa]|uniref:Uncharacterized protein n=1 Tax=Paludisphaera mucosa TaxID=3030827 RepID=A0ABT6FHM0_9BACT|nr:hypothetical protein [Paludisphaera mucosa]MDG3006883.1 hypothetical protein [Paludisphaera mucosa]
MDQQVAPPPGKASGSRTTALSLLLNAVLLGWIAFAQLGNGRFGGDGVSLVLANDTEEAMIEPTIEYPGGAFKLPELPAGKSVGTTIPAPGRFEATLTFKDGKSATQSRKLAIKPVGELLVVVHVLPAPGSNAVPPPTPAAPGEGGEGASPAAPPAASAASPAFRVIVAYQGENTNI